MGLTEPLLVRIQFEWTDIVVVVDIAVLVDIVVLNLAKQQHYLDSHLDIDYLDIGWDTDLDTDSSIDLDTDSGIDLDINS